MNKDRKKILVNSVLSLIQEHMKCIAETEQDGGCPRQLSLHRLLWYVDKRSGVATDGKK